MSAQLERSVESPGGPPPRTNGTPSGYRNIRVLTPSTLHFRLVAYAGLSLCSLNEFILKVLHLATPIDPTTGLPVPASPSPGASDGSRLDQGVDPVLSGSSPALDVVAPPSAQDRDGLNHGGGAHA